MPIIDGVDDGRNGGDAGGSPPVPVYIPPPSLTPGGSLVHYFAGREIDGVGLPEAKYKQIKDYFNKEEKVMDKNTEKTKLAIAALVSAGVVGLQGGGTYDSAVVAAPSVSLNTEGIAKFTTTKAANEQLLRDALGSKSGEKDALGDMAAAIATAEIKIQKGVSHDNLDIQAIGVRDAAIAITAGADKDVASLRTGLNQKMLEYAAAAVVASSVNLKVSTPGQDVKQDKGIVL